MTHEVDELLDTFDHLPEAQQRAAAPAILLRVQRLTLDPMSDAELLLSGAEGSMPRITKGQFFGDWKLRSKDTSASRRRTY